MRVTANDTLMFKHAIESYDDFIGSQVAKETLQVMGDTDSWTKEVYRLLNRRYRNNEIANDNADDFLDLLWERIEIHTPNYLEQKKRYTQLLNMSDSELLTQQRTVSEQLGLSKKESELIAKRIAEIKKHNSYSTESNNTRILKELDTDVIAKGKEFTDSLSNTTKSDNTTDTFNIQNFTEHTDTRVAKPLDVPLDNISNQTATKGVDDNKSNSTSESEHNYDEKVDENRASEKDLTDSFEREETSKYESTENATDDDKKDVKEELNTSENIISELFGDYSARLRAQITNCRFTIIGDYLNKFSNLFIRATTSSTYH